MTRRPPHSPSSSEHADGRATTGAAFASDLAPFLGAFERAYVGNGVMGLDGRWLKVNHALCQMLGYRAEELQATDWAGITHCDDRQEHQLRTEQLLRGDVDHYQVEKRCHRKDGQAVWVQFSAALARDGDGHPSYAVVQVQDITPRKLAELQSARRLHHLERLTETVSRILETLANRPDAEMYPAVLKLVMDSFQSPSGWFLRLADDETLIGPYIGERGAERSQCESQSQCPLWEHAFRAASVVVWNQAIELCCGPAPRRSLVTPIIHAAKPLGLFHLADAAEDYNADDADLLTRISVIIAPVLHARLEHDKLTPREAEVMDMIVSGMSQKEIATSLGISVQTTAKHRARVLEKLNLKNDVELVRFALRMRPPMVSGPTTSSAAPPSSRS